MDAWETLHRQIGNCLATVRRVIAEAPDTAGAADAVRDYLREAENHCAQARKALTKPSLDTIPTNGREGEPTVAEQIDPIIAHLEETGRLAPPPSQDPSPVHPFLPPHLAAAFYMNQPTGEE